VAQVVVNEPRTLLVVVVVEAAVVLAEPVTDAPHYVALTDALLGHYGRRFRDR
jgi:hypothetical protein